MSEARQRTTGSVTSGEKPGNAIPLPSSLPPAVKKDIRTHLFFGFLALGLVCDVLLLLYPHSLTVRLFARYSLGVFFVIASIPHFTTPRVYLPIMPPIFPAPLVWIYLSGFFEGLFGLLCFAPLPWLSEAAVWGLLLELVAIFPANIWAALSTESQRRSKIPAWFAWARLPMQAVFLLWCWLLTTQSLQSTVTEAVARGWAALTK